jgi:hypothetical protein
MQKYMTITATALTAAALLAAGPAHADTGDDFVCQMLDQYGPSDAVFNQFARSARNVGASSYDFRTFMYDQLSLCPSYKNAYFQWQAGI